MYFTIGTSPNPSDMIKQLEQTSGKTVANKCRYYLLAIVEKAGKSDYFDELKDCEYVLARIEILNNGTPIITTCSPKERSFYFYTVQGGQVIRDVKRV